jgi:predicted GTPase
MPKKGSKKKVGEADQLRLKHNRDALDAVDSVYTNYPNKGGKGLSDYSKEINAFLTRFGLVDASSKPVSSVIHKPRSRITVMVVGNHSSGKSSFINWYVGQENLLKTSMAIETKGITFVAKGNKEEEYGSDATLRKFPEILNVGERTGDPRIMKCISTMLSTSSERLFPLVTFVDTPGLVDTTEYPFDVNKGIEAMADHCDKILVFLDPMGKATCSRTMNVIRLLMKKCADKTEFYLTKADSIGTAEDAMTVAIQICKVSGFEWHC